MLVIDTGTINFIAMVAGIVSVVGTFVIMYVSLQNKANIQSLSLAVELRMNQLINMAEQKANAVGQMQGRDWATKQTNEVAVDVVKQAANTAADLLATAVVTANQLKGIK